MKLAIQRVRKASVRVDQKTAASIGQGLLILVCIETGDGADGVDWFARKTANLRIFSDSAGKFNLSIKDVGGECLVVSQFTLAASWKKGNRPSFTQAAPPQTAESLYLRYISELRNLGIATSSGVFAAKMDVELINDGPVTLFLDSRNPH